MYHCVKGGISVSLKLMMSSISRFAKVRRESSQLSPLEYRLIAHSSGTVAPVGLNLNQMNWDI